MDWSNRMKKWISYIKGFVIIILIILVGKFLIYLLSDDEYPASPYDQQLLEEDIVFDIENGDLDSLIEAVDSYVHARIEECDLISIRVGTRTRLDNNYISRVDLKYSIEDIEDYLGFCDVICYYQEEQWVMTDIEKKYYGFLDYKLPPLNIKYALKIYKEDLNYLQENNFFGGVDYMIIVNVNESNITIYGENRSLLKEFTRLNDGEIEYSE